MNSLLLSGILVVVLVWGVNLVFWGCVGLLRKMSEVMLGARPASIKRSDYQYNLLESTILPGEVAVVVPAHNEELVIADTILSLLRIVPENQIYIVSDGSKDQTSSIAHSFEVNVLALPDAHGKAGALESCIHHFDLLHRVKAVLFVDADTRLRADYLLRALPFFSDARVAAVAGYASTIWNPRKLSWRQLLFLAHRERVYFFSQLFIKFGQTWHHTNVAHIVPGFASIYRTSVLAQVTMNPPGLVIEDFNMTFEVHHKRLGMIAHSPDVVGFTQDPDNLRDYYRQIRRWHLGLWQTIRLHGMWRSKFWLSFSIMLLEVVIGSLFFLSIPIILLFFHSPIALLIIFGGIIIPDYLLTVIASVSQRRPQYLTVGLLFPLVRCVDAAAFLFAIPKAFLTISSGRWTSPSRRVN